jgi:hypothetical protein
MVDATAQREAEALALAKRGFAEQKARTIERQNALMLLQMSPALRSDDQDEFLQVQEQINRAVEILAVEDTNFKVMKDSLLQIYPHEPLFGGVPVPVVKPKAGNPITPAMVKELPGFKYKYDTAPHVVSKDNLHTDVFEFIEHFEQIFSMHHVDVNVYYKKALEYCLSKTILGHYKAQQGKLTEGQVET